MSEWIVVRNPSRRGLLVARARWCESFLCRLRGLMFRRPLPGDEALLLVEGRPGRLNTAIHMAFVFQSLGVAWLDEERKVVEAREALPWRWYAPRSPARYVLEGAPQILNRLAEGDRLVFESDEARR